MNECEAHLLKNLKYQFCCFCSSCMNFDAKAENSSQEWKWKSFIFMFQVVLWWICDSVQRRSDSFFKECRTCSWNLQISIKASGETFTTSLQRTPSPPGSSHGGTQLSRSGQVPCAAVVSRCPPPLLPSISPAWLRISCQQWVTVSRGRLFSPLPSRARLFFPPWSRDCARRWRADGEIMKSVKHRFDVFSCCWFSRSLLCGPLSWVSWLRYLPFYRPNTFSRLFKPNGIVAFNSLHTDRFQPHPL